VRRLQDPIDHFSGVGTVFQKLVNLGGDGGAREVEAIRRMSVSRSASGGSRNPFRRRQNESVDRRTNQIRPGCWATCARVGAGICQSRRFGPPIGWNDQGAPRA
jgi:hypothetical protein